MCVKAPTPDYAPLCKLTLWGHILLARVLLLVFHNVRLALVRYDLEDIRCFPRSVTETVELKDSLRKSVVSASAYAALPRNGDHVPTFHPAALPNCFQSVLLIELVHGYVLVNSFVVHFSAVFSRACGDDPLGDSPKFL